MLKMIFLFHQGHSYLKIKTSFILLSKTTKLILLDSLLQERERGGASLSFFRPNKNARFPDLVIRIDNNGA